MAAIKSKKMMILPKNLINGSPKGRGERFKYPIRQMLVINPESNVVTNKSLN